MKAAQIRKFGDPSVVQIVDVSTPEVKEGYVLVKVHAVSLNPFDTAMRIGSVPFELPATLGGDFAGVVEAVGPDVTNVAVGDKVYGQANILGGNSGAFAEYALTKADQIAKMPTTVSYVEAASLVLVGVSALQGLSEHINLRPGQKILIQGGSGGIGTVAIQIAKDAKAHVATTVNGSVIGTIHALGADEIIDYETQNFEEVLDHDFDAVFDTVGGDTFLRSLNMLKPGGVAVSMIAQPEETIAKEKGVQAMMQHTKVNAERLQALCALIDAGTVTPHVAQTFPFARITDAFTIRETTSITGKIVLEV
ncbi:NADP-dependent oxidoreductase [Candidatus Saccharibacteria bacterium]|nr:NADP-dependent oxidoreductase [Candidatus Saccharibacteria bacterium]